jgi:hypothetical protein
MAEMMSAAATVIGAILIGVIINLISDETQGIVPKLAHWLLDLAVARLPERLRARYDEEWAAVLNDTRGPLTKVWCASGFLISTRAIIRETAGPRESIKDKILKIIATYVLVKLTVKLTKIANEAVDRENLKTQEILAKKRKKKHKLSKRRKSIVS